MLSALKLRPNLKAWLAGATASISVLTAGFLWSGLGLGDFLGNFTTEQGLGAGVAWVISQAVVWAARNTPS